MNRAPIFTPHQSGENLISEPVPVPVQFIRFVYSMFTPKREETSREGGDKRQGRDPLPFPLAHNSPSKLFFNLSNLYQIIASHSAISAIGSSISRVPFRIRSIHIVAFQIPISIRPHLTGHTPPFPSLKQISKKVTTHLRVL